VVAAAVILHPSSAIVSAKPWRSSIRIDDSKALTARQRERAFECILRDAHVGVGLACAEEIDQHNILQAALRAMARAIGDLPIRPELILVDGPAAPHVEMPCWPVIHGDALSRVIACASIVAKVTRDRLMQFYHRVLPHYAFDEHKGYGTSRHRLALAQWGPSPLHRLTFRPVMIQNSM
jgi:ribonuclease HII